ncbi:MAG: DUF3365 domain-containing protein [Ignavibacteriales bacterium]|nr:DUF3365 domain-containing protein [Ignavibacteriales bacterium]
MKKIISLSVLLFIFCISCAEKPKSQLTENIKSGLRQDAKEFMGSLKEILVKEMQTNGAVAAVSVCSDTAQILTNKYGVNKGIYIKRVSFKNRNINNVPNKIEAEALKIFEELKLKGELKESTEYFSTIENDGVTDVIYLKPILVQAPCLSCHGADDQIGTEVKGVLHKKYPNDKATGYQLDDLRGAVSIQKTL